MPVKQKTATSVSNATAQTSINCVELVRAQMLVEAKDASQRDGLKGLSGKGFKACVDEIRSIRGLEKGANISEEDMQSLKAAERDQSVKPIQHMLKLVETGKARLEASKVGIKITDEGCDMRRSVSTTEDMDQEKQWDALKAKRNAAKKRLDKAEAKLDTACLLRGNAGVIAVHEGNKAVESAAKAYANATTALKAVGTALGKDVESL